MKKMTLTDKLEAMFWKVIFKTDSCEKCLLHDGKKCLSDESAFLPPKGCWKFQEKVKEIEQKGGEIIWR